MSGSVRARLLALLPLALLLTGCGVSFGGGASSEVFKDLRIAGEPVVGRQMAVEVDYEQPYDVAVDVSCFVVRPERGRRLIGRETLTPNPDANKAAEGSFSIAFVPDRPGKHIALCNTPLDPENAVSEEFEVAGAPAGE